MKIEFPCPKGKKIPYGNKRMDHVTTCTDCLQIQRERRILIQKS